MKLQNKIILCIALLLALILGGCGGKDPLADAEHLTKVVNESELHALKENANLKTLDIIGSTCYPAIMKFMEDRPDVDVIYSVDLGVTPVHSKDKIARVNPEGIDVKTLSQNLRYLPNLEELELRSTELTMEEITALREAYPRITIGYSVALLEYGYTPEETMVDLSAMKPDQLEHVISRMALLPELREAELMDNSGQSQLAMADVKALTEAYPNITFHYTFDLFGKTISTTDTEVEFINTDIGNQGEQQIRNALDILPNCTRFLLDGCGLDNEVLAGIREDYPDTKIVWRVKFGKYSTLTDAEVIRAVYNVFDKTSKDLRYCTDAKYIDMGHNEELTDISFMGYMPKLEIVIVSGSAVGDISCFENCPNLEFLEIAYCGNLRDLSPLKNCEKLRFLNISFSKVESLAPLDNLPLERFVYLKPKASYEEQELFKAFHPDCWTRFTGSDPYTLGWRYDDQGHTFSEFYQKMRDIFHYDKMND